MVRVFRCPVAAKTLHHLVLHAAGRLGTLHHIATLVEVFDVRELQRATAVLVASELRDGSTGVFLIAELHHAGAT